MEVLDDYEKISGSKTFMEYRLKSIDDDFKSFEKKVFEYKYVDPTFEWSLTDFVSDLTKVCFLAIEVKDNSDISDNLKHIFKITINGLVEFDSSLVVFDMRQVNTFTGVQIEIPQNTDDARTANITIIIGIKQ